MAFKVTRVSPGTKNYLFGFHDLVQTNAKGDLALALEVEDITHPPLQGEFCQSGVIDLATSQFRAIHTTRTWNYPQGARQQWIGESDLYLCNDREEDGRLVCRVADARIGKVVDTMPFPVHCCDAKTRKTFGINYDRVHACGGYGYTPNVEMKCSSRIEDIPADDGIFIGDLDRKKSRMFLSLAEIAACGEKKAVRTGYPHYVTHLILNPSGTRLVFLHRYRLPDGGETTRLMTIGTDGSDLRCLAKGFLSHLTWTDDDKLFIWGKDERALCAMREAAWLRIPGVLQTALLAKKCLRGLRGLCHRRAPVRAQAGVAQDKAFLLITDEDHPVIEKHAIGILTEDGHPMASPANTHYMVSDTYPNAEGDRWLMFYDLDSNERTNVGLFRRLFAEPDPNSFDWHASQVGIDKRVLKKFPRSLYLFARSGYHTDLHPRWSFDGRTAFFDSIHEGSRQIYCVAKDDVK